MRTSRLSVYVSVSLLLLALVGCATTETLVEPVEPQGTPDWIHSLSERVAPIPSALDAPDAQVITPTEWSPDQPVPRGQPTALTNRITQPSPERPIQNPTPAPAPAGTGPFADLETGSPVIVNINGTSTGTSTATPQASSASQTADRSRLEELYGGTFNRSPDRELEQFGYDYFGSAPSINEVGPVPANYLIGPGDEIIVSTWGNGHDAFHRLTVDRDGQITVPEVGTLPVAGRRFDELYDLVHSAMAETLRDFELSVSLGRLRRIQIQVVGAVRQPGLLEVPARTTVLSALVAAGGPTKSGSLRRVEHRRGHDVDVVDLYSFLVDGAAAANELLVEGDIVFVPPIGPTVGIAGYVQRPAIYELTGPISVDAAFSLAGGLTPFTFTPRIQIERTSDGRGRETIDVTLDQAGLSTELQDGELLLIGAVDDDLQPVVRIVGQVVRAGDYQFRDGLTIGELVRQADGLTIDAFLPQAFVSRQVGSAGTHEVVPSRIVAGTTRRVLVINLEKALAGDPEHDVPLMPLDLIEIQHRRDAATVPTVAVLGPVRNPGSYELTAGLRVSELIAIAGNLQPDVYYDEAELIRRVHDPVTSTLNAQRYRFDLGRALREGGEHDPVLNSGDQLVIRALRNEQVTVRIGGEVRFPGSYVFPDGAKISDLIAAAGGVLGSADLRAAVFSRDSVRDQQRQRFNHLVEATRRQHEAALESMVQTGRSKEGLAAAVSLEQTMALLERMGRSDANGRIVVPFLQDDFPESDFNLTLESGDELVIPRRKETVSVIGHVFNPSTFVASSGITVEELLRQSGGATEDADDERIYVLRANGVVQSLDQPHGRLSMATTMLPGDVLLVPRRPLERTFGAKLADAVLLAREMAEVALFMRGAIDFEQLDFTAVHNPIRDESVGDYDSAVLRNR